MSSHIFLKFVLFFFPLGKYAEVELLDNVEILKVLVAQ